MTQPPHILIIDDEPILLEAAAQVLKRAGYHVLKAATGDEGWRMAQAHRPDLILLDVVLPDQNGLEIGRRIKSDPALKNCFVVLLSAIRISSEDQSAGLNAGVDGYIVRPIPSRELLSRVQTFLRLQQAQTERDAVLDVLETRVAERTAELAEANARLRAEIDQRERVERDLRRRNQELALLNRAAQTFNSSLDLDQVLTAVLEEVRHLLDVTACSVWLLDLEMGNLVCHEATGQRSDLVRGWRLPIDQGIVGWTARHGESLLVPDAPSDERYFAEISQEIGIDLHAILSVPLRVRERIIGVLQAVDTTMDRFSPADQALLELLSAAAAIAIENAQLYKLAQQEIIEREHVEERQRVSLHFLSIANRYQAVDPLLHQFIQEIAQLTGCTAVGIRLLDPDGSIPYQAYQGFSHQFYELESPLSIQSDQCMCINVITRETDPQQPFYTEYGSFYMNRTTHFLSRVPEEEKDTTRNVCNQFGYESVALIPIRVNDHILGLIHVADPQENQVPREMVTLLETAISHLGTNLLRVRAEEALRCSLEETARRQRLLLALNQAAQAVQQVHTPPEVYQTIGDEITRLGYQTIILTLSADQNHLIVAHLALKPNNLQAIEELTGLSAQAYRFPISSGSLFQAMLAQKKTIFATQPTAYIAEALPQAVKPMASQVVSRMNFGPTIIAPMKAGPETVGLLTVIGADLTEADMPAVTAFANQAAIALENARLYQNERQAQDQLHALAGYLETAREEERTRVAREIHDELGQTLTALKMDLAWLIKHLPEEEPDMAKKMRDMSSLTDDAIQTVRRVATELRPGLLDDLGLEAALEWQAQEFTERTGIPCTLRLSVDEEQIPLERDLATTIFRIFQETLTNVTRHAEATDVQVELGEQGERGDELVLMVRDNGRGIRASQLHDNQSLGLIGMRERARAWEGEVTFESAPDHGTTVTVRIPLSNGRDTP